MQDILCLEKTFRGKREINYIFKKAKRSKYLIVVFSAFASVKSEIQHPYHYIKALQDTDISQLFIQDSYGPSGTYYLCENMDFSIEDTVSSLIKSIVYKNRISKKNVICAGTSKGGSAAIYFAMKHNFGYVIAGAPQIKIGSYLIKEAIHIRTANYMMGEDLSEKNISILDNVLYSAIKKKTRTVVRILNFNNDHTNKDCIYDFVDRLKSCCVNVNLSIENNMTMHGQISLYYPDYMKTALSDIQNAGNVRGITKLTTYLARLKSLKTHGV